MCHRIANLKPYEKHSALSLLNRFETLLNSQISKVLSLNAPAKIKARTCYALRTEIDTVKKIKKLVEDQDMRIFERQVALNIKSKLGLKLTQYTEEQVFNAWQTFCASDDFPNMDKFESFVEKDGFNEGV